MCAAGKNFQQPIENLRFSGQREQQKANIWLALTKVERIGVNYFVCWVAELPTRNEAGSGTFINYVTPFWPEIDPLPPLCNAKKIILPFHLTIA